MKRQNSKLSDQLSLGVRSTHASETELRSVQDTFDSMLSKLKDLQTQFMQKAAGLPKSKNAVYKLISLVQNDNCKFVLHNDDSFELPKSLRKYLRIHICEQLLFYPFIFTPSEKMINQEICGVFFTHCLCWCSLTLGHIIISLVEFGNCVSYFTNIFSLSTIRYNHCKSE